jgi:hypothetical protein
MRSNDFESDDAAHQTMLSPEHSALGSRPKSIQDYVSANDQAVGLLAHEAFRLKLGQDLLFHQTTGQYMRVAWILAAINLATHLLILTLT